MTGTEQHAKYIAAMVTAIVVNGLFAGYCFHEGLDDLLFVPLLVGLALVFVLCIFIEKRANLLAGETKTPEYRDRGQNCDRKPLLFREKI